ncbi:hypothetical protein KFE25_009345 [Diacronema lutheri]|uniref:Uncharacterized protein n=1 Tax=Diacronema lutheri TaxID=2081491 RepID=A0A8J5XUN5_DIALT|nr:hypothetical protein KFE25_009345 [Diacronema lutheri]
MAAGVTGWLKTVSGGMRGLLASPTGRERHSKLSDEPVLTADARGASVPAACSPGAERDGAANEVALSATRSRSGQAGRDSALEKGAHEPDRMLDACLRLVERERRRRQVYRAVFSAWRDVSAPARRVQRLEVELAYWRRSVEGARQVIDEQQRKLGEQALKIASLQKDHIALTSDSHRAHAFVGVVEEQTRAIGALQMQVAAMARMELSSGEEHSRSLASTAVRLAEQARLLLVAMRDRERRLDEEAAMHAHLELMLNGALDEKARLEARLADHLIHARATHAHVEHDQPNAGASHVRVTHQRSRSVPPLGEQLAQLSTEYEATKLRTATSAGASPLASIAAVQRQVLEPAGVHPARPAPPSGHDESQRPSSLPTHVSPRGGGRVDAHAAPRSQPTVVLTPRAPGR